MKNPMNTIEDIEKAINKIKPEFIDKLDVIYVDDYLIAMQIVIDTGYADLGIFKSKIFVDNTGSINDIVDAIGREAVEALAKYIRIYG